MLIFISFLLLLLLLFISNEIIFTLYLLDINIDKDSDSIFYKLFYKSSFLN